MSKKFTICISYEGNFKTDEKRSLEEFQFRANQFYANDLLKLRGVISLNEILHIFYCSKNYSYRWGWELRKHGFVDVKLIRNPTNDHVWYLKFTAFDIVG